MTLWEKLKRVEWGLVVLLTVVVILCVGVYQGAEREYTRRAAMTPQERVEEDRSRALAEQEAAKLRAEQQDDEDRRSRFCVVCVGPHIGLDGQLRIGPSLGPGIELF